MLSWGRARGPGSFAKISLLNGRGNERLEEQHLAQFTHRLRKEPFSEGTELSLTWPSGG